MTDGIDSERLWRCVSSVDLPITTQAGFIGISDSTMTNMLGQNNVRTSRNATLRTASKIADYYGVSIDWLCGR